MPSPRVTNEEAGAIGFLRAIAECRNQACKDALLLLRQQTVHLRRGDVDASAAFAGNLDDTFHRSLALSEKLVLGYHAPKSPAADQALMNALFPLETEHAVLLDAIGAEMKIHTALVAQANARLASPGPAGESEVAQA